MIDKLTNCPNCGGALNEAGRCRFCGSKVYDFLTIDFNGRNTPSEKTYIRLKIDDRIVLAPVRVNAMQIDVRSECVDCSSLDGNYVRLVSPSYPRYKVEFMVIGDVIYLDEKEGA